MLTVRRQPEGMGARSSTTGIAHGGSPDCHRSKAPLLSGTQRVGSPLQPLSFMRQPLPPRAQGRAPTRASSHAPAITSSAPHNPQPGQPTRTDCHLMDSCIPIATTAPSCLGGPLASITTMASTCLMGSGVLVTSRTDSGGRNTHIGGAETTAEPQGWCD